MLQLGTETEFRAAGRTWKAGRLEISVIEKFLAWVRPQLVDPVERLAKIIDKLPPALAEKEYHAAKKQAEELDALDWFSPQVKAMQETNRGQMQLFLFLLQINQPDATLDEAFRVAAEIGPEEMGRIFARAAGEAPRGNAPAPAHRGNGSTGPAFTDSLSDVAILNRGTSPG